MPKLPELRQLRQELLGHISAIEQMRRGSIVRQFLKLRLKGQKDPVLAGPYARLSDRQRSDPRLSSAP